MRRQSGRALAAVSLVLAAVLALSIGAAAYVARIGAGAPPIHGLQDTVAIEPSVILSADGTVLATLRQDLREPLTLAQISPHVIQAA
ncbi:MAG: hypothetical protein QM749_11910 [Aquabacterium sp.]